MTRLGKKGCPQVDQHRDATAEAGWLNICSQLTVVLHLPDHRVLPSLAALLLASCTLTSMPCELPMGLELFCSPNLHSLHVSAALPNARVHEFGLVINLNRSPELSSPRQSWNNVRVSLTHHRCSLQ